MPSLPSFPVAKQAAADTGWACVARAVINYQTGTLQYATDRALADACAQLAGGRSIRSALDAVRTLGLPAYSAGTAPVPPPDTIWNIVASNQPLLASVTATVVDPSSGFDVVTEAWVAIVGLTEDKLKLQVFDPAVGQIVLVDYDPTTYWRQMTWNGTWYIMPGFVG